MYARIGQPSTHRGPALDLKTRILDRMRARGPFLVWTPVDFSDLGARAGVDKALQRLATSNDIRRIDRGLYDLPALNRLIGKATTPDYAAIIDAVAQRDQIRILVDGLTAANQLGLADAVPAHVVVHTDARIRPIKLGNLTITFKLTAPSRLYWAGRPAMRVVQALHWLRDLLPTDQGRILQRLQSIISDPGAWNRNSPGSHCGHPHAANLDAGSCPKRNCPALSERHFGTRSSSSTGSGDGLSAGESCNSLQHRANASHATITTFSVCWTPKPGSGHWQMHLSPTTACDTLECSSPRFRSRIRCPRHPRPQPFSRNVRGPEAGLRSHGRNDHGSGARI